MAGETILIIDDTPESADFLRDHILEPNGYATLNAATHTEAIDAARLRPVALIVAGLDTPRSEGLQLLKSLRRAENAPPVIVTPSQGAPELAAEAFRLGAIDCLSRPFSAEHMLAAINRALAETHLRRERAQLQQTARQTGQQLEAAIKERRILDAVGQSIAAQLSLEQVLNRVVEAAIHISGAEEGSVLLLDEHGDLCLRAARGLGEESARNFRIKVQDSIAGQVVRTGEPVVIGGQSDDESFKVKTSYFVKSLANLPVKLGNRVIGILSVNNKETAAPFTNHHLELLTTLANYTAIAIEYTRLYDQAAQETFLAQEALAGQAGPVAHTPPQAAQAEMLAALGRLASGVAHEISPPLDLISSRVEALTPNLQTQPRLLTDLAGISEAVAACRETLQSLLDYAGHTPQQEEPLALNEAIEAAWQRLELQIIPADIEVIRRYTPDLRPILADRAQLEQAFFYLLQNALNAMHGGGTLRIITRVVGDEVQAIVADTGPDISAEDIRYIFNPFYRSSRHSHGLGFAITYSVIERHNGVIEVDSKPGSGITFTVRLPALKPDL
ncbi:MAG: ATP-binding protein [Anaerolineae bacterium]